MQQIELARAIGMDPPNLRKIERGKKNLTIDTLLRLAVGLDARLTVTIAKRRGRVRASTTS